MKGWVYIRTVVSKEKRLQCPGVISMKSDLVSYVSSVFECSLYLTVILMTKKKTPHIQQSPLQETSKFPFKIIKLAYNLCRRPAQINSQNLLPTSASTPAVQVTGPTATQNSLFLPPGSGQNHRQYSLQLSPEGWQDWVTWKIPKW